MSILVLNFLYSSLLCWGSGSDPDVGFRHGSRLGLSAANVKPISKQMMCYSKMYMTKNVWRPVYRLHHVNAHTGSDTQQEP
jgi:hypothetical protein